MDNKTNHSLSEFERAWWAASKLQAQYRGRQTRRITSHKKLAVLKSKTGLGILVMSRIAEFATATSANFIQQLEEEALGHTASTILQEATGDDQTRADELETTKHLLDGKSLQDIQNTKARSKHQELDGFELQGERFVEDYEMFGTSSTAANATLNTKNLFVKEFNVYPKLVVSFESHREADDCEGVIVQRCWCEVPNKAKPMRILRVRQDQIEAATTAVVRHSNPGETGEGGGTAAMSEGGFSSESSLGDSDDLNSLYSDDGNSDAEDMDLELSTNLHDLV